MPTNTQDRTDPSAGVTPAGAVASRSRGPLWADLTATFFRVGLMKPGPGTWGSTATILFWALVSSQIAPANRAAATFAAALLVTAFGIPAATVVSRATKSKDPQIVVIDEVAGQLVTLIAVPLAWKTYLVGFILFRVFDTLKPPPARQLEHLPEGWGVVLDDLAAGIYGLIVMHLLLHFGLLTGRGV